MHNHEVRWPYVFASGYLDGLQIFNLQDPLNPVTVGCQYEAAFSCVATYSDP